MSSAPLSAGDYIAAKCSKCGQETNHTIVALVEDKPVKVQCNTCNGEHKYRKPAAPKKAAAKKATAKKPSTRKPKVDPVAVERQQWQDLEPTFNPSSAQAYSMDQIYKLRALIDHPTFGLGQVQQLAGTRKMLVLFSEGSKVLRCG